MYLFRLIVLSPVYQTSLKLFYSSISFTLRINELLKIPAKLCLQPNPDSFSLSRIPSYVCSNIMGCNQLITQLLMEVQGSTLQAC